MNRRCSCYYVHPHYYKMMLNSIPTSDYLTFYIDITTKTFFCSIKKQKYNIDPGQLVLGRHLLACQEVQEVLEVQVVP